MSSANATSDAPLPVVPHKEPLRWLIAMRVVLFGLVKAGNTLLGILGNPPLSDNAKAFLSRRFGTDRIALIVARVNRALALAGALQVRLFDRIAAIERASVTRAARGSVRAAPTERVAKARPVTRSIWAVSGAATSSAASNGAMSGGVLMRPP